MRKLTIRERVLLLCLAVVAAGSGYILFFHMPMEQRMDALHAQIAQEEELQIQLDARLMQKQQMEQVLNQLAAQENPPHRMPEYDNLQAVMVELNRILASCQEYSISFQEDKGEGNLFYRRVTIPFTCANYEQAKATLQRLHDSPLRGLLTDLQLAQQETGVVKGTAVMTFFEYLKGSPKGEEHTAQ